MAKSTQPTTTGELPPSQARPQIVDEAKRLEETALYSSKGHHNAAAVWGRAHLWLGLPTTILSTLVGAASFAQFAKQSPDIALIAGCISVAIAVLSGIITFLNPNKREAAHLAAAHAFDRLNNESRVFWSVDCWLEKSEVVLTAKLRDLIERKADLNAKSPQIPRWAYKKAKASIEAGEADFKVDKVNQTSSQPAVASQQPESLPSPAPAASSGLDSSSADKLAG
jgi:hypothetical protein